MYLDGLEDAYEPGRLMRDLVRRANWPAYQFTREMMDDYAVGSLTKAKAAVEQGRLRPRDRPVEVISRKETRCWSMQDEQLRRPTPPRSRR